jgi:hypothetical protein
MPRLHLGAKVAGRILFLLLTAGGLLVTSTGLVTLVIKQGKLATKPDGIRYLTFIGLKECRKLKYLPSAHFQPTKFMRLKPDRACPPLYPLQI